MLSDLGFPILKDNQPPLSLIDRDSGIHKVLEFVKAFIVRYRINGREQRLTKCHCAD
jgi:hypothetical protein